MTTDSPKPSSHTVSSALAAAEKLKVARDRRLKQQGTLNKDRVDRVETILANSQAKCSMCAELLPSQTSDEVQLENLLAAISTKKK